jgi:hypothetical protein
MRCQGPRQGPASRPRSVPLPGDPSHGPLSRLRFHRASGSAVGRFFPRPPAGHPAAGPPPRPRGRAPAPPRGPFDDRGHPAGLVSGRSPIRRQRPTGWAISRRGLHPAASGPWRGPLSRLRCHRLSGRARDIGSCGTMLVRPGPNNDVSLALCRSGTYGPRRGPLTRRIVARSPTRPARALIAIGPTWARSRSRPSN